MTEFNWKLFGALALVLVVLSIGYLLMPEDDDEGAATVRLLIEFRGEGELYAGNLTVWEDGAIVSSNATSDNDTIFRFDRVTGENQTALDVLLQAASWGNFTVEHRTHGGEKGTFVESIAGVENGEESWQYYINDEYGVLASDRVPVSDGDIIRWELE